MESTSPKYFCFVLMPFNVEFDDIYKYGIKESCKDAGAYCERVDEQIYHETMLERIYNQISKADLIIADMTGKNPNVFYEVGYAHALNKPTILLTQESEDIPFDLKHFPHIVYGKKISIIRDELTKRLQWFQTNQQKKDVKYKTEIDIYVDDKNLSLGNVVHQYNEGIWPEFEFTIHNNSTQTYQPGDFQIGIISDQFTKGWPEGVLTTRLPDKNYLHMLPFFEILFPGAYASFRFRFQNYRRDIPNRDTDFEATIRVYTAAGSRDYSLNFEVKKKT